MDLLKIKELVFSEKGKVKRNFAKREVWKKKNLEFLFDYIQEYTSFLPISAKFKEKIHCVLHQLSQRPKCKMCDNKVGPCDRGGFSYNTYCSIQCGLKDPEVKQKRKYTNQIKYNGPSPINDPIIKAKIKKTMDETFHGVHPNSTLEVQEKRRNTCFKKFGVDHHSKSKEYQENQRKKQEAKTGHSSHKQLHIDPNLINSTYKNKEWLIEQHHVKEKTAGEIALEIGVSASTIDRALTLFEIEHKRFNKSSGERQLTEFVQHLNIEEVIVNSRKIIEPYELDIFIPSKQMAIEHHGTYWHSSNKRPERNHKNYHLEKYNLCREKNITLLQIFEHEWLHKKEIVKSIICNKLGISQKKIYARKCTIKEVSKEECKSFLIENHLQGYCCSSIKLGLFFENELVFLMTFGKPRFNKKYEWELIRLCSKKYYNIIGASSKILSYFEKKYQPKSLISYADLRYSTGKIYETLNFTYLKTSSPGYFYVKNNIIYPRYFFQKAKLKKKLGKAFDPNLSETENLKNCHYNQIWDAGNKVYIKEY